jgi:Recombinase
LTTFHWLPELARQEVDSPLHCPHVSRDRHGKQVGYASLGESAQLCLDSCRAADQRIVRRARDALAVEHRAVAEEHLSCRQLTKRLSASTTLTPTGKNHVWHPATVRNILTNRVYAGEACDNYRQPVIPQYCKQILRNHAAGHASLLVDKAA